MEKEKILEINHMKISFCQYQKGMHQTELPVISDLNVTVRAGEMVAIVGSSGSGRVFWRMEYWESCPIMHP